MIRIERPKRGRPLKDRRRFMRIVGAIDYRGLHDDQLFFVFRAPKSLVVEIFEFLVAGGRGIARQVVIRQTHDILRRFGKAFWRVEVEVIEPNFYFCSLEDMKILIEGQFVKRHPCSFRWVGINKFLNL